MAIIDKIWISGADGRLGSELVRFLEPMDFEVLTTDIDEVDVRDMREVELFAEMHRPKIVINCSSITEADECESDPKNTFKVNTIGARNIAVASRNIHAKIVHFSTDDVFDGNENKPYHEFDQPHPVTNYGKSKYLAEEFVRTFSPSHFIIRSSWVYSKKSKMIKNLLNQIENEKEIIVAKDQVFCPTSARELSRFIAKIITTKEYGTYHASCEGVCNLKSFAQKMLEYMKIDKAVRDDNEELNKKFPPNYSVIDNFLLHISDSYKFPKWEDNLLEFVKEEVIEK